MGVIDMRERFAESLERIARSLEGIHAELRRRRVFYVVGGVAYCDDGTTWLWDGNARKWCQRDYNIPFDRPIPQAEG